ncbi:MAG: 6-pyruvoyl-tetrahydropterin synthase-related protein [Dehalococcoidia bacterium]
MASTGAALRPAIAPKRRALSVVLHPAVADLLAIVAVLLAALPAIWPLTRFRFLSSHDGTYHLLRLVEFDRLVRQGELFPGWFPTFASGYGYPLLSYYPPLSYFPAEILHLLGLGYVDAVKAALALPILLSGVGAYLLGRDILGSRLGGWLTAVAFMYAPYHLIDTYVRAILSESWVFPFLPLLLWSLRRAAAGSLRQVGLAALWWAGLILAHNVIALFFTPLALLFGLLMVGTAPDRKQAAMRVVGAFGLALTVSAAYWLPALAENGFVSTSNFNTTLYRPEEHLNALDEIVSTDLLHEYAQSPFRFGLIQVALALAGLAAWPWARGRRVGIAYAAGLAILFCALLTSLLVFVWSVLPLIAFVQFPTRLLAIAALGTGILTGAVALFPTPLRWFGLFGAAALVVSGVARIDPPPLWPQDADLTGATIARFEHDSGIIGTTTAAEYLPAWSRAGFVPPTEGFAEPVGTANDPALAARVRAAGPLSLSLDVTAAQPAPLRLHVFFFPGWTARIDGQSVPIRPTTKLGLLTVDVPAGTHQVDLSFGPTALRLASLLVSLVGLSVVGLLVVGVGGTLAFGGALIVLLLGARLAGEAGALRWSMIPPVDGSPVSSPEGGCAAKGPMPRSSCSGWLRTRAYRIDALVSGWLIRRARSSPRSGVGQSSTPAPPKPGIETRSSVTHESCTCRLAIREVPSASKSLLRPDNGARPVNWC